jgi:hypothetical protein
MLCSLSVVTQAQTIKVEKIRGKKALVEIIDGRLTPGESYNLGKHSNPNQEDEFADFETSSKAVSGRRGRFIALGGNISSLTVKVGGAGSDSSSDFSIDGLYGFNKRKYEFGPIFSYSSEKIPNYNNSSLNIGAFYDHNLVPHTNARDWIYGLSARALIGNYKFNALSGNSFGVLVGGAVKYYPFHPANFAVRIDAGYNYINRSTKPSQTITGFDVRGTMVYYF